MFLIHVIYIFETIRRILTPLQAIEVGIKHRTVNKRGFS